MRIQNLIVTLGVCMGLASIPTLAKNEIAQRANFDLGLKVSEDLILNIRSSAFMGNHFEQFSVLENTFAYDSSGVSGWDMGVGGKLLIGNIGKAKITGIAEIAVYNRNIVDSALSDSTDGTPRIAIISPSKLRIYTPKTGINIQIPVSTLFAIEMNNTFERRIATKPKTLTHWIWSPQILARTVPLTLFNLSPYVYYESFDNKDERYLASFSFGINCEPITDLMINLGDRVYWNPEPKVELTHQRIHQIYFSLGYTFDMTK